MAKRENYDSNVTITSTSSADIIHNNGGNNVSINAGAGNDSFTVEGEHNVTVSGGTGNDYVQHEWGAGAVYVYSGGNDTLKGFHNNTALVIADKWSSIRSDDSTVLINVEGKGTITLNEYVPWQEDLEVVSSLNKATHYNLNWNDDSNKTFNGTSGADYLYNRGHLVKINGKAGNDYIENYGSNSTVDGGAGNDHIDNHADNVTISAGTGNDLINNVDGNNVSIDGGAGNDSITVEGGHNVTVSGGKGNDTIKNWADNVTIDAGANDDNIENNRNNVSINLGSGNDFINNTAGKNVTISGGKGNDLVHTNQWDVGLAYVYTSGNDTINGLTEWSTLVIKDKYTLSRDYYGAVVITIEDKGTITLPDYPATDVNIVSSIDKVKRYNTTWSWSNNTVIAGTSKADYVFNGGNNVIINGFAGNDYIEGNGSNVTMNGGDGNDKFFNGDYLSDSGNSVLINGDAGDDSITNGGDNSDKGLNVTMNGGAGKDYLRNYGNSVTINGGTDNDYIRNGVNPAYLTSFSMGSNVIINGGDGSDRIENATSTNVTITGGSGDDTIDNYLGNSVSINGGSGNDVIENSGFNVTILGSKGNDTVWNNEAGMVYVYKPGEGNDYISGFGVLETLVVDGAKFTTVKSGSDVLVKVGENTITLSGAASLAKVNIVTSTKGIVPVNVVENSTENKKIKGKASSNWIRNYADKVTITSGSSTDDIYNSGSNVVIKGGGGYDQIRSYASDVSIQSGAQADKIISGNGDNVSIDAGKGNDVIDVYQGVNLFVRGGKGNDTVNLNSAFGWNGRYIFTYAKGDGKDVISKGAIINLIDGATIAQTLTSGSDTVLKIDSGSVTVKDTKPEDIIVVKDNDYSPYLVDVLKNKAQGKVIGKSSKTATQKIRNYGETSTIIGGKGIDSIYNEASSSSINAGAGDDYLQIGDYNISGVTALGGAGNDTIYNNGKNASIDAGTGNDTIISEGNSENVTIDGGKGHDVIEVQGTDYLVRGGLGNDTVNLSLERNNVEYVFEYAKGDGKDVVSKGAIISLIDGAKVDKMTKSGSDTVLKIGSGSITVKDTKPADVEIVTDGNYEPYFGYDEVSNTTPGQIVNLGTSVHRKSRIQNDADNVTIQSGDHSDTINSWGHNVLINAGNGNNYIYSYSTNGTIIAGGGDDSVYTTNNDNDKNYIDLGGGANYIYNNGTNTTIKSDSTIGDTMYTCPNSANNVIICGDAPNTLEINGSNSTVKGGKKGEITEIYADSGLADGDAGDDYIYKAGVEYYDFNEALEKMSKAIRDASKEQLEDIIIQFDTNPDLKSVIEQGEKSPVFADMDKESAKKIADAVKASKEFAEASLAYEADGKGTHFANYLREKGISYANTTNDVEGVLLSMGEVYYTQQMLKNIDVIGDMFADGNKVKTFIAGARNMQAFQKAGTVGNVISGALAVGDLGLNYASYSEAAEFYEKKRQGVINNMSEENLAESLKQLEEIDKARGKEGAKVVASGIDAVGAGVGIAASMALVGKGAAMGFAFGGPPGAVIGGGLTAIAIAGSTGALTNWAKNFYLNRDHPYAGNIPTWNEITGKKSNVQNSNALMSESNAAVLYDIAPEVATTTLKGAAGNDALANKDELVLMTGGTGNDFLVNHGNKVTLQGDSGDDYISNTGDSALINTGKGHDLIENAGNNINVETGAGNDYVANEGDNVTINALAGNNTINSYSGENIYIVAGSGSDSIVNALGSNIKIFSGDGDNVLENYGGENVTIETGKGADIVVNYSNNVSINAGNGDNLILSDGDSNTILSGTGDDIIILDENNINTLIKYSSGKDIIYGLNKTSTLQIGNGKGTYSAATLSEDVIVTVGKGKISLVGAASLSALNINGTDIMSLTLTNDSAAKVTIESPIKTANASSRTSAIRIVGNAFNNSIVGGSKNDSLYGGNGNDYLSGEQGNDKIYGQNGADSLLGGSGNDTLTGGKDNDFFIYNAGNDVIADFTSGQDKIQIASGKISKTSLSGSDVLFTIGKGSLTVKNAKGKTISLLDSTGKASSTVVGAQALTNSNKASVTIGADMGFVDASKRTKAISITGNALANTISGGSKNDSIFGVAGNDSILGNAGNDQLWGDAGNDILLGGKGDDSLWGGDGNDTLTGNDGNDFFIYESGKDVISDYTAGQDKILIAGGKISKTSLSGSNVLFTIGKGSLTVKNAKGKTISLLDSSGKASSTVVGAQTLTNSNKASVTIGADMGAVDASARTKAISITGNALANTICGGSKNDSIFGAAGNDSIIGNAGNDKLYGDAGNDILLGGKGNDSLWGGVGNDSLWGDAGKDTFIYTVNEGTDKIFDYADGDMLKILNADGSDGYFKSSKYSGGDLTLTINGGGKIIFDDVASTTKFNINGLSYNISGSKLVKK